MHYISTHFTYLLTYLQGDVETVTAIFFGIEHEKSRLYWTHLFCADSADWLTLEHSADKLGNE